MTLNSGSRTIQSKAEELMKKFRNLMKNVNVEDTVQTPKILKIKAVEIALQCFELQGGWTCVPLPSS
ncbi:hypothetical protein TNCV_2311091 [Trichonephila clavipes]|nr:hypothetical protein TNCV_2311091 [Trichonephila clavipes]